MIQSTLDLIKEQTGISLSLCPDLIGIRIHNGEKYFNVILNERITESKQYDILKQFSIKYKLIKIEPNGLKRVSIYPL